MPGQPIAIPRVELLEELGRGAHSVVHRARRDGRYFAVKQPIHGETGAKAQLLSERFRREAVALARVRHPALPAVMEVGEVERVPYIIMELAAGETLSERLRQGPLSESHLIEIARQLADGLAAIHRSGLVHRDVKPKNILFDSQTTAVRLVDFGFAASADARLWHEGPAGTPGYMAPEQASALRERVDGRADLFSLGCVLLEAVTGMPPFADADALRLLQQHAGSDSQPSSPSGRTDEEPSPRISREFAEIIAGLLERDPDERYQTAEALLEDLEQLENRGARRTSRRRIALSTAQRSAGPELPLVGRDRELSRLRAAWLDSQAGHGRVLLVKGAAGIGKTRLVQSFLEDVARAGRVALTAVSQASDPKPFSAIRQLIEAYVNTLERLPGGDRVRAIARLRDLAGDVAPLLRVLSPRLSRIFQDSPPIPRFDDAAHVFAEGLTEFLLKLVRDLEPAVVFIDNAHWLDAGSRRVVARMAERSLGSSVLTILGARTGASAADDERSVDALLPDLSIELALGPLDEAHIMPLVQAYLGRPRVDTDVLRTVASLTDGSALASLEVLRAMLDAGVLVPWWGTWKLDREALVRIQLPRETVQILARRISALDEMTRSALRAAAIVGMEFDDDLLADAAGLEYGHVNAALAEARRALLIEGAPHARHRFVHDSVREVLLSMLSDELLRETHQRIAECLDQRGPPASVEHGQLPWRSELAVEALQPPEELLPHVLTDSEGATADFRYALASHYASGQPGKSPRRVLETNVDAAKLAFRAFDNERALSFFAAAGPAATLLSTRFDSEVELLMAEALLRTGALEQSLERFERLIASSSDRELNARALSRIAWIQMQLDSDAAERALDKAFVELDVRPPSNSFFMILLAVLSVALCAMLPRRRVREARERRRLETLVTLYYLRGRLAFQMSRPVPFVQATLLCQDPAERLGPSDALTRSCLMMSFLWLALGWQGASRSRLARAERIGRETRDPVVQGHVLQVHAVIAAWSGNVREALEAGFRSLEDFGHWRELAEFCGTAYDLAQIEGLRGRARDAWRSIELAVQKVNQHDGAPLALDYLETAARAALASLGREHEADSLLGRLRNSVLQTPRKRVFIAAPFGSQARLFTESGRLGPDFETFVAEIRKAGHDPRRVHIAMTEYYVHVAHARVHACLRASGVERTKLLGALSEALRDLKLAARIPLLRAHARVVEGYEALFRSDHRKAERLFGVAQALGEQEGAPWVLYAVQRGRAHLFSEQGRPNDARDQAKLAEALAREHGAAHRLHWIREEFSLAHARGRTERGGTSSEFSASSSSSSSSRGLARRRGYLRALLRITEARDEELTPERQAAAVLDEMVQSLGAERGLLLLASDAGRAERPGDVVARLRVVAARSADARDLEDPDNYDRDLVEEALTLETEQLADNPTERRISLSTDARRSMIVAPIVMHEAALGAIYLERPSARGVFSEQDGELLSLFALQVPVALELARALYIRERAEEALRNADKLEAVGKLAGGVAHDFNNMLTVILASTDAMMTAARRGDVWQDVTTIRSAAERARDLTRQLMAFARGQYSNPERLLLNDSIRRLEPVFRRLLGATIELELRLEPELYGITADPAQVDQVLTNLAMNAGDAMPRGGRLIVETSNVIFDEEDARSSPRVKPGRYALVIVSDTGEGMDEATRARIFEPFFTTKADRSGTGLGLATVYGIVTQAGGHIEVTSRVGVGTVFRIFLPRSAQSVSSRNELVAPPGGAETVMIVDDEPLVRDSMRRMLHRLGYHVLLASGGDEALRVADAHQHELSLVITDVLMPGMNGLELARELSKRSKKLSVLFVSGYTDGVLAERGILRERVEFLQKPISYETLARRVREVLDG